MGKVWVGAIALLCLTGCGSAPSPVSTGEPKPAASSVPSVSESASEDSDQANPTALADVTAYELSGEPGAYTLSITISSPDLGCQQYADWWEVTDESGNLLYRRILAHSHVDEQPFSRSGGPVDVQPDQVILVRAHMNPGGYGGQILKGTLGDGLNPQPHPSDFALTLAAQPPLPDGCTF
ncbi:MAG: hypothetical protein AAF152_13455 [Cyanobacteria bacterium P01_A01_bin.114]